MVKRRLFLYCLTLALLLVPALYIAIYANSFGVNSRIASASDELRMKARNNGLFNAVQTLDELMTSNDCVLVFRLAEYGYYGKGCYFRYLDERLIPLYKAETVSAAMKFLEKNSIHYVTHPEYGMAEVYNSLMGDILANPLLTELVTEHEGVSVYRLRFGAEEETLELVDSVQMSTADFHPVKQESGEGRIEGETILNRIGLVPAVLISGEGGGDFPPSGYAEDLFSESTLFRFSVSFTVEPAGYVSVEVADYVQRGREGVDDWKVVNRVLWRGFVKKERTIRGQMIRRVGTSKRFRMVMGLSGPGKLEVNQVVLDNYGSIEGHGASFDRAQGKAAGWNSFAVGIRNHAWAWGNRPTDTNESISYLDVLNDRAYVLASPVEWLDESNHYRLELEASADRGAHCIVEWLGPPSESWFRRTIHGDIQTSLKRLWAIISGDVFSYSTVLLSRLTDEYLEVLNRTDVGVLTENVQWTKALEKPPQATALRVLFVYDVEPSQPVELMRTAEIRMVKITSVQN